MARKVSKIVFLGPTENTQTLGSFLKRPFERNRSGLNELGSSKFSGSCIMAINDAIIIVPFLMIVPLTSMSLETL